MAGGDPLPLRAWGLAATLSLPLTFAARPSLTFRSWDGFVLPLPFARGVLAWGAPLRVPRPAPLVEPCRGELERALAALTLAADGRR